MSVTCTSYRLSSIYTLLHNTATTITTSHPHPLHPSYHHHHHPISNRSICPHIHHYRYSYRYQHSSAQSQHHKSSEWSKEHELQQHVWITLYRNLYRNAVQYADMAERLKRNSLDEI